MLPTILRANFATTAALVFGASALSFACNGKSATEPEAPKPALKDSATLNDAPASTAGDRPTAAGTATKEKAPAAEGSASLTPNEGCPVKMRPLRHKQKGRLVALGDVHGDLAATRRALRLAGAIDENDAWVGGTLQLVQTGDILDRGDDEQEILDLFLRITEEARAAGGAVYQLHGNHELMNAMGDFRYVTRGGFADFATEPPPEPLTKEPRARAFFPGGTYAKKLAELDMVTIVGDSVFVHGGVLPRFAADLEASNRDVRCFLLGGSQKPPAAVLDPEGPLWTREFSNETPNCGELQKTLTALGVRRMVVGHTPQLRGITSACDEQVWRIDTGMASYYQGPTEVLEIDADGVRVLR